MLIWIGFLTFIGLCLALDLGVLNRRAHVISFSEAAGWTGLWVSISLLFSIFVFFAYEKGWVENTTDIDGQEAVLEYLSGYLAELSLSLDNIFVIALVFRYFKIPAENQHRVLFWGILGAVVFRGIMIGLGVLLIHRFEWMTYVFGVILLIAAIRMLKPEQATQPGKNPMVKLANFLFPVTDQFDGDRFFIKIKGVWTATPMLVALLVVELTDIMFAFDSIPAIFAITKESFIIFSSNIFAILGLRSMYFLLAAVLDKFHYLKYSLVAILIFVAAKMLLHELFSPPSWLTLVVIASLLSLGVGISYLTADGEVAVGEPAEKE